MSVVENALEEFGESLFYGIAYKEVNDLVKQITSEMEDGILKEAVEDSLSVLTSGLLFYLLRYNEKFFSKIFEIFQTSIVTIVLGGKKIFKRLPRMGRKLIHFLGFASSNYQDRIATANLLSNQLNNHIVARGVENSNGLTSSLTSIRSQAMDKKKYENEMLYRRLESSNDTLFYKLVTGGFSSADLPYLNKVIAKNGGKKLKDDDLKKLNSFSEFVSVEDLKGNKHGLTSVLLQWVNGMSYTNLKKKEN